VPLGGCGKPKKERTDLGHRPTAVNKKNSRHQGWGGKKNLTGRGGKGFEKQSGWEKNNRLSRSLQRNTTNTARKSTVGRGRRNKHHMSGRSSPLATGTKDPGTAMGRSQRAARGGTTCSHLSLEEKTRLSARRPDQTLETLTQEKKEPFQSTHMRASPQAEVDNRELTT